MSLQGESLRTGDLLRVLTLPLIDGYFLAMVLSGSLRHWSGAVLIGLVAFSGAGVFSTVALLKTKPSHSLTIIKAYGLLLPIAWGVGMLASAFKTMEFHHQNIFASLILLSAAMQYLPIPQLRRIRHKYSPATIMGVLLGAMLIDGIRTGNFFHMHVIFSGAVWASTSVAVLVGMLMTLLFTGLGNLLHIAWDEPVTRTGFGIIGSAILILVAIKMLGFSVADSRILWTEALLLVLGLAMGVVRRRPAESA